MNIIGDVVPCTNNIVSCETKLHWRVCLKLHFNYIFRDLNGGDE